MSLIEPSLNGGAEPGEPALAFDWSVTPLGSRGTWSAALTAIYEMMMASPFAMCAGWGPELTLIYNEAYADFLAARHPAALGQPIEQVWHDVWADISPLVERAMAGEHVHQSDMHLVMTRKGRPEDTYWTFAYSPLRDGGQVVGFLDIAIETTGGVLAAQQRDEANRQLSLRYQDLEHVVEANAVSLRLFESIVQSDEAPILAFDHGYRVMAFNQAHDEDFHRVMGRHQRLGDVLPDLFPPEQAGALKGLMDRALAGERFVFVREFGDPGLMMPTWEITYTPIQDATGQVVGAFHHARDISERVRAETELAATQEALRQSQKMEAVGQLTGGLAHDFNNLLAGISGSLELMERRIEQGRFKDLERYMSVAQGAAKRAAALTHRLLAFSRRQTLDPKPTDVNRLIMGMDELIRRTIGPQVSLEVVGASGLWPTLIDPGQLENALLNLCINARDAMPEGGRITIETANRWLDRPAAITHAIPEGQYLSVCVTDTGTGMTPEIIAKVFEPFFTTKPTGEGTGLGLSMIYGFAQQSGGQVRIYSEIGQGTTVCMYLPRHHGEADANDVRRKLEEVVRVEQGETVLVVDDEPSVRMLIMEVLDELGHTGIEAADSVAGLKLLQSDVRIDLLVTDVGLPGGMNGRQMADAGREKRADLKVLFITGYAENAAFNNGHLKPGMQVMTKPFAMQALASKISAMMA